MIFDLRTCESTMEFLYELTGINLCDFTNEFLDESDGDFEKFWNRNFANVKSVEISDIKVAAFHVLGSLDDCSEIKTNGLKNLQEVLSSDTILSRKIKESGIVFDLERKIVSCGERTYNIDYEYYRKSICHEEIDEVLDEIAYRFFYDYCISGFIVNDNIYSYLSHVHERPEFLMTLSKLFEEAKELERYWKQHSVPYKVDFCINIEQIERFTFSLDEQEPPFEGWSDLDDSMKIKKWMLSKTVDRLNNRISELYIYVNDKVIPPEQIISCTKLEKQH